MVYFAVGLVALNCDRDIEQFRTKAGVGDQMNNQCQWLENNSVLKPMDKKTYWPKFLQRKQESKSMDLELQARPKYEGSRPTSHPASIEISICGDNRSRREDGQTQQSSLVDSSVANISAYAASTVQHSTEASTNASSSLINPDSARSSAVISSASSMLPAYSE